MEEQEEIEWRLVKKIIQGEDEEVLNLESRCFEFDDLEQNDDYEAQIPRFQQELDDLDIEVFKIQGHQFMTSDGVYRIVKKINENQYE